MDAPAKCLMQNFVQFNGFSGCPYCLHRRTSVKTSARGHTHAYPFNREDPLKGCGTERTHEETLQHAYEAHKSKLEGKYAPVCGVKGYSWFRFIPGFDIIKDIAVDYMHCVLLGVTKMLTTLWFDKAHAAEDWNISKTLEAVDRRLLNITPPNCISRPPRSIAKDFAHWKASEYRSFLFFYAIPCLWNILPDEYFHHFILFVEAIWLLDQSSISPHCLQKARKLLLQKIPELIPLLPFGSGSKKFHEHLTRGRYLLKCKREEISDSVFALGVMSPATLSTALMSLIENRLGCISKAFMFQRIQMERDIIHSKSYLNVSRRNSCTVFVENVGFLEIKFYVKLFLQCPNVLFCTNACICKSPQYYGISDCCLRPATDVVMSSDQFTHCEVGHIIPVRRELSNSVIFPVTSVKSLCVLVDCKHSECLFFVQTTQQI